MCASVPTEVLEHGTYAPVRCRLVGEVELLEDRSDVGLHGALGDVQPVADRPIRQSLGDQREHVPLPRRQRLQRIALPAAPEQPGDDRLSPVDVSFEDRDQGIYDGTIQVLENSVLVQDRAAEQALPYATVDLGLWPRSSALLADPGSAAAAAPIAEILKLAAADVVAKTAQLRELDVAALASACSAGARFALAGAGGLAAMRNAVKPVLDGIAADAEAAPLLTAVRAAAKTVQRTPLEIPSGCDGAAPVLDAAPAGGDPSVVNGSFQTVEYTEQQLLDAGFPAQEAINASAQFTLVFEDGDFELIAHDDGQIFGCDGEYTVEGDQLAVEYFPGGDCGKGGVFFTATFAVDDAT